MFNEIRDKAERLIRKARIKQCDVPFVVLFRERSGSSHLCSILSNHPDIVCRHEDFHEKPLGDDTPTSDDEIVVQYGNQEYVRQLNRFGKPTQRHPTSRSVIGHFYDIFSCPVKAAGFKFKFPLQPRLFPEIMQELGQLDSPLRIITLDRKNPLKRAISRQNMLRIQKDTHSSQCNLWEHKHSTKPEFPFRVNVDDVVNYARFQISQTRAFVELVEEIQRECSASCLEIYYEDLLRDEPQVVTRVYDFLEVDSSAPIYSSVKKATPDDLRETVLNLDELRAAVSGTPLESFLES